MGQLIDLTGKTFGRLFVEQLAYRKKGLIYWKCKCSCGNTCFIRGGQLRDGKTSSCGCYRKEKVIESLSTHGRSQTRIYHTYYRMLDRCYNEKDPFFPSYGGRGIRNEFESFDQFLQWSLANGYRKGLSIDRIDNDGNYSPLNCRWVTMQEQQHNKRNTRKITFKSKTQSLTKWAQEYNISPSLLTSRLNWGWQLEDALTRPPMKRGTVYKGERACL